MCFVSSVQGGGRMSMSICLHTFVSSYSVYRHSTPLLITPPEQDETSRTLRSTLLRSLRSHTILSRSRDRGPTSCLSGPTLCLKPSVPCVATKIALS